MDQQLAALDSLQSMVDTSPSTRMPCPRAAAAASQANVPDVLAYMASSRFGPAMLSTIAQQVPICLPSAVTHPTHLHSSGLQ